MTISTSPDSSLSPAFGDALRRTQALQTAGKDSFGRLFSINAAGLYPTGQQHLMTSVAPSVETRQVGTSMGKGGTRFSITSTAPDQAPGVDDRSPLLWTRAQAPEDVTFAVENGRFSQQSWSGRGGLVPFVGVSRPALQAEAVSYSHL